MDPAEKFLKDVALSRQRGMLEASARGDSEVQRFYCGRSVFLTGGSGFLGKQLIEKLLRSCKVSKVFLLLRSKKGKTIHERLDDLSKDPVFDELRKQQPDFRCKMAAVDGDVAKIRLGLNAEDWKTLTKEVDVIFHVAATTRFDEKLQLATLINLRGTRECLSLGRACTKLSAYVHVSTAYTHTTYTAEAFIEEIFYKSPIPPETMISMAEHMDDERLTNITTNLIKDWPNTYSFTKALSEELIRATSDGLPICIVRPGIVISTLCEPTPGWIDINAIYSASGVIVGSGLGLMHTILADADVNLGFIPCDYVNNTIIVAGRETAFKQTKGGNETKIYNVTPTSRNSVTFGKLAHYMRTDGKKFATPLSIYHAEVISTTNEVIFAILSLLLHLIPAYVADFACLLIGKERRFVKIVTKMYKMSKALAYFLIHKWVIHDHNTAALYDNLSEQDKVLFNFNLMDIDWQECIFVWCMGLRKYVLKDGLKNTEYGVKKQKFFKVLNYFVVPLYAFVLWKAVYFVISTVIYIPYLLLGY